jgi:hypothetical protein
MTMTAQTKGRGLDDPHFVPELRASGMLPRAAMVAMSTLLLSLPSGMAQSSSSQKGTNPPATPGVQVDWQDSIPPVSAVVTATPPCLQITPDTDTRTLIAANRCGGPVTLMAVRDMRPSFAPFVPTAQEGERQFAIVTVPQYDYVELTQPAAAFYFVPLAIPNVTTAAPNLQCLVDPTIGQLLSICGSASGFGSTCSCPAGSGHIVIAPQSQGH